MLAYEPTAEYGGFLRAFRPRQETTFERQDLSKQVFQHSRPTFTPFESVEAANFANVYFWAHKWGVTLMQIRIAVARVGSAPEIVLAEIRGTDKHAMARLHA